MNIALIPPDRYAYARSRRRSASRSLAATAVWFSTIIIVAAGERALEPVQLAVRAGVERAVVEVMSRFYNVSDSGVCASAIQAEGDPMGPGQSQTAANVSPAATAIEQSRANPDAWNDRRDDNLTALRGRS
jgi:curli production assembly/transport component CsgG/holdfast attachment protein HfaB